MHCRRQAPGSLSLRYELTYHILPPMAFKTHLLLRVKTNADRSLLWKVTVPNVWLGRR